MTDRWLPMNVHSAAAGATGTAGATIKRPLSLTGGPGDGVSVTSDTYGVQLNIPGVWHIFVRAHVFLAAAGTCTLHVCNFAAPGVDEWYQAEPTSGSTTDPAVGLWQAISGTMLVYPDRALTVTPQFVATANISNLAELTVTTLRVA